MKAFRKRLIIWLTLLREPQITKDDTTLFFRQLATLITSGIPLVQSCSILEKSASKNTMRSFILLLKKEMETGKGLSLSLQNHPAVIDTMTCHLIKMGEQTGTLEKILQSIALHQEKIRSLNKKIKQILFYPACILCVSFAISLLMLLVVIPRFAELFQNATTELPPLTRGIFFISLQLRAHVIAFFFLLLLMLALIFYSKKSRAVHLVISRLAIKLPLLSNFFKKILLARYAKNLALTLSAGITVIEGLKLTAQTCGNLPFTLIIYKLRNHISQGLQLHEAMQNLTYFPPLMIQMVKVGEESGQVDAMLEKIAEFLEADVDHTLHQLSHLLEPLIMVILGVLIGGLVIGMYLPIFKLGTTF